MILAPSATQILIAAEKLFAKRGYDGVSMQQIAADAGISKANIYHHFKLKDELYLAVLKCALQDMKLLLTELQHVDGTSAEQLAHFSIEHLKHINAKSNISRLILREMLDSNSSRGQDLAEQVFAEYFSLLRSLLCQCQERGEIRRDIDPDHMAAALAGMNIFLFQSWPALQHFPGNLFKNQHESGKIMFELLYNGFTTHGDKK
ncbi:TetR/AcrR family transcriptional regulator [Ghiorsea bivora]|uniref:TetR/AcrR family transcriptional regulator n=1 Tax=Ghiorsea bivora TaxID=1485545 RepID=UPI00068AB533|nr:TetR/AcrR family transcriptional regulator [Ghiorsea bivora]